jgi:hypothetical protein
MGMSNTPLIAQTKIIESMVFVDYPKEGIIFLIGFGMAHSSSLFDACKTTSQT